MTKEEIIDGLEIYTVGRSKQAKVYITVEKLQKFIDAIKELPQESKTDGDFFSRQAVEDAIYDATKALDLNYEQIMSYIDEIPSGKQEPETGYWIRELVRNDKGGCIGAKMICSNCGKDNKHDELMSYCPCCGKKMKGRHFAEGMGK